MSMTEYELDQFCEQNPDCGGNCTGCPLFAKWLKSELED
ncbi:hypothetical protein EVA_01524 [gut metagenome]|uniref:Uncharacterized protein n=1 Tax=gut metagenome TaxID=749906 RepID=J9DBK8_9ZZZZ